MSLRFDCHTHSYYSDGVLSPTEVVVRAAANEVKLLALTDHDSVVGLTEAQQAADQHNVQLVAGVEISCLWQQVTIHVLGLGIDPNHSGLTELLTRLHAMRWERAHKISEKIAAFTKRDALAELDLAPEVCVGRLHFARWLSEQGFAGKPGSAFSQHLKPGKNAYVKMEWPTLEEVVSVIHAAGGQAVIAHPRRYKMNFKKLSRMVAEFKALGGDGLEVLHPAQRSEDHVLLMSLVKQYGLCVTGGSDFHYEVPYCDIGRFGWLAGEVPWASFIGV